MTKESARKWVVVVFIVVGVLFWIYEVNKPGPRTVEGVGQGYGGDIVVKLDVIPESGGKYKIVGVDIQHNETPFIGGVAIDSLKEEILRNQNKILDEVVGATVTRDGVQEGYGKALRELE